MLQGQKKNEILIIQPRKSDTGYEEEVSQDVGTCPAPTYHKSMNNCIPIMLFVHKHLNAKIIACKSDPQKITKSNSVYLAFTCFVLVQA